MPNCKERKATLTVEWND